MTDQPEALRLADRLEGRWALHPEMQEAAAELRRLHAENEALQNTKHYEAPRGFVLNPDYLVPELQAERDAAVADADLHRTRCASLLFSGAMDDKLAGEVQGWVRDYVDAKAERDAAVKAIVKHNNECQNLCGTGHFEASACGYRVYFEATGLRCPECPTNYKIEWPQDAAIDAARDKP